LAAAVVLATQTELSKSAKPAADAAAVEPTATLVNAADVEAAVTLAAVDSNAATSSLLRFAAARLAQPLGFLRLLRSC